MTMSAFEKWWVKATANYVSDNEVAKDGKIAKAAWNQSRKETLEEVLEQMQLGSGGIQFFVEEKLKELDK